MSLASDLKILYHLALRPIRGGSHAERMDSFYQGQAEAYDSFRRRLLQGREELWRHLPVPRDGVWIDMGGGTGSNLEYLGPRIHELRKIYVVDLARSLLDVAARRAKERGWKHVEVVEADATTFVPTEGQVDVISFSYSLTMIPDWFAALEQAHRLLRAGGHVGVVDFYVSRKYPVDGRKRHGRMARNLWPVWFGADNVFLSPDHVPYLHRHFQAEFFEEHRAGIPYIPLAKVPYYLFVGRKEDAGDAGTRGEWQKGKDREDHAR